MLWRIAWRNLWRNPRRTGLTAASGAFAVLLILFQVAVASGSHERWIETAVKLYPGHLEVSLQGYRDQQTLDYGMVLEPDHVADLDQLPDVAGWAPRLEAMGLVTPDRDDALGRAIWLIGHDPGREYRVSRLGGAITEGRNVEPGANYELVLGTVLARSLDVAVGDQVVVWSSDYYGSQSADRFAVVGLLSVGDPRFDGYAALISLSGLQEFVAFPGGLSHVAVFANSSEQVEGLEARLAAHFPSDTYEVAAWPELIPEMVQMIALDKIGNYLILAILVVVVAFGVLNTILMSVLERTREFGVLRAVGTKPGTVFWLVLIESLLICALGVTVGLLIGIPVVEYFERHPIPIQGEAALQAIELFGVEPVVMFRLNFWMALQAALAMLGVAMLAALAPAWGAARGRPVDALREV